jgi:hypothetical protein
MFKVEAIWIAKCLQYVSENLEGASGYVLNLGSSTKRYREVQQPFIDELIFSPMKDKFNFIHADAKSGSGIDLSGDFCSDLFWRQVNERSYDVVICSNLLTHVLDIDIIINNINRITKRRAYVIITSPFIYPYCSDPHDSKFRPSCQRLASLFTEFALLEAVSVYSADRHIDRLIANKRHLLSFLANVLLPTKGAKRWVNVVSDVPNVFLRLQTSCVFLARKGDLPEPIADGGAAFVPYQLDTNADL